MRETRTPNVTFVTALPRLRAAAALCACACVVVGCKDTRSANRPPPPGGIATGATHASLHDPRGSLAIPSVTADPPRVKDPFDAPPHASGSADPLAPPRTRPTEL